ncbi:MAG: cobalamin-independent methionine synthase II family protein [Chloroflexota bacterium]
MSDVWFPVTTVGSWPRSNELLKALKARRLGRLGREEFDRLADAHVLEVLRIQTEAGADIVTDGEQRRDNFFSFIAEKVDGTKLMSLADMLDYVEDKAGFEEILRTMDVPAFSMFNPTAVGRIARREPLALAEYRFLREHTDKPIKVTLPGPYLLTRAMWLQGVSQAVYPKKEDLADDVVMMLQEELKELAEAGADFVQFDEPVLSELVFSSKVSSRAFMCASLSIRNTPKEELELAVSLINRVIDGTIERQGTRTGVHVCRGNWSVQEEVLLRGPYDPLLTYLERMNVDQLVLEYATPRAGDLASLDGTGKELGLGVVNPRTEEVETPEAIVQRVREAAKYVAPERIFLNPDCGFGTFASRPMNAPDVAAGKIRSMAQAARILREEYAGR